MEATDPPVPAHAGLPGDDIFLGDGEMARLMRAHDWAATPLGPPAQWPHTLKVAMRLLLTSRFEMWLGWGPDIAFFYNDAYRPTLADKHPRALGMPTRVLWAEIWDDIRGRLATVYERGEATWDRALMLLLLRHGHLEETYHTFSYSPLLGDTGRVEGVFCAVTEETDRVVSERRLESLRHLSSALTGAVAGRAGVLAAAEAPLRDNAKDLPFTLTWLFGADGGAQLAAATGIAAGEHPAAPSRILPGEGPWDLGPAWRGEPLSVVDLGPDGDLPRGAWDTPPRQAAIVPIGLQGAERPVGALVVGLNPYKPFDAAYADFLGLLAGQLGAALAGAATYEAERAERDRLHGLFRRAPSFMCLLSGPDHVFTLVNEAYRQLVGHRDLEGLTVRDALPEIDGQGFYELLDNVYRTGQPFVGRSLPVQLQREPGMPLEQRYVNLVYQPVFDGDGQVEGIFVDGHDVTHQKRAEDALQQLNTTLEQRVAQGTEELRDALARLQRETHERTQAEAALQRAQKMESLGALTGGVAHDFNNLLQVISGNLQLLGRHLTHDDWGRQRVASALGGVARGAKLAQQLLAFGRRQPLEPRVIDLGRFLETLDELLRRALGEEVEIATRAAPGLWNTLVDPGQVENALLNLAINARDAMDGRGRLEITAANVRVDEPAPSAGSPGHEDLRPGDYVAIAVTDTGTGMPPEVLERVFEPFFSTKPEGKGTGLGLSMVYGFVKQSGGHVTVASREGAGTTFTLYLPRTQRAVDPVADVAAGPVRGGDETILVVEDDDDVRETAVAILADLGYRVLKARDALGALGVLDSGVPVDLLFTDVVMPGPLRSPDMVRLAQARLPGLAVLFASGYTEDAIMHGGRLDPGVELLSKPYTREALARRVRHVLANQAQRATMGWRGAPEGAAAPQGAVASTPMPTPTPAPTPAPTPTPASAPLDVLLVEDDLQLRESTAELLETLGHRVHTAADGDKAIAALAGRRYDVLLTDVRLPGRATGLDVARHARSVSTDTRIVFVTGDAGSLQDAPAGSRRLLKPYTPDELQRMLARSPAPTLDREPS